MFFVRKGVLAIFLLLLFQQFFVLGLIQPLRIESGSMVSAFLGPRYEAVCKECRIPFFCGAGDSVKRTFLTCPDCGFAENPIRHTRFLPGERIVINRLMPFKRFDTIVFRNPASPSLWSVKRLVAFPGETVAFREGNLWVNGKLYHKTLDEQRTVTIPYPFGHWIDESTAGVQKIFFDPGEPIPHFAPLASFQMEMTPMKKRNVSFFSLRNPYNQLCFERREDTQIPTDEIHLGFPKRFLSCEIMISTKYETITVKKTDAKNLTIFRGEEVFADVPIPTRNRVELSVIDRMFRIGDGKSTFLAVPLPNDAEGIAEYRLSGPIVLTGFADLSDAKASIEIRVDPYISDSKSDWVVPAGHYFVLGDNVSISEDSRHWESPFIPQAMILGIAHTHPQQWWTTFRQAVTFR